MSYYARNAAPNEEERPRSTRRTRGSRSREIDTDVNANINNNNSAADNDVSSKSTTNLDVQKPRRPSGSKSPAPRRKSTLIETMAANFERKNTTEKVATASRTVHNGEIKSNHTSATPKQTLQVPGADDTEDSPTSAQKKVGPSARRGKQQREKRMLRQKRRSTGVVNLKDMDNEEEGKGEKKEKNASEETDLQKETDLNTQNNELSPVQGFTSVARVPVKKTEIHVSGGQTTETNGSCETTPVAIPHLSSSRRHNSRFKENANSSSEVEELRLKLELAEATIFKLHQELKNMDEDLHALEEENHKLKQDNKMLEDENTTMLRLIRRS